MARLTRWFAGLACLMVLAPPTAGAQATGGISGVVRDSTQAVLPGVTVELASPALIEQTRTTVTDADGRYSFIELRSGTYVVTFTLTGFGTVRREGIELTTAFNATVNATLQVGALQETLTVTGASPTVDVRTVAQPRVVSRELIDTLPIARTTISYIAITPGILSPATTQDVGGTKSDITPGSAAVVHGIRAVDNRYTLDGLPFTSAEGAGGGRAFSMTGAVAQEITVQLGGGAAESELGGILFNVVPKQGGNRFESYALANYTGKGLQSSNLSSELTARGLRAVDSLKKLWNVEATEGGPIVRNKVWFFGSARSWGFDRTTANVYVNSTPGTLFYTPDPSRLALIDERDWQATGRITWQVSPRNKVAFSENVQYTCICHQPEASLITSPEAVTRPVFLPNNQTQASWSFPVSSGLLLESAFSNYMLTQTRDFQAGVTENSIAINDLGTGFAWGASSDPYGKRKSLVNIARFAVTQVRSGHTFKTGVTFQQGSRKHQLIRNQSLSLQLRNGAPAQVTEFVSPQYLVERVKANLGLFVQDQWTLGRFTLNGGIRLDYLNAYVPKQDVPATRFAAARTYDAVNNVPNWKDVSPRAAIAWDVFGNGRTAVKASIGRYVLSEFVDTARANNPAQTSINSATRSWSDANGNFLPDCDLLSTSANGECGPTNPATFGSPRIATRYADGVLTGLQNRPYNWQTMLRLQQELAARFSVDVSYFRTSYRNHTVTDNVLVTSSSFDPYCIDAPVNASLPGGGGNRICGLADITPALFGRVDNVVDFASTYGRQKEIFNGIDVNLNGRFGGRALLSGGFSTGQQVNDRCFVVDSPQELRFCRVASPWSSATQLKLQGSYGLPWDVQASATYQNVPGAAITATWAVPNALIAPSLGRNLSGNASSVALPLIAPNTMFGDRINQVDVRFAKTMRFSARRVQAMVDVFNLTNSNTVLQVNGTYGGSWLTPQRILDGRLVKFGVQVNF